MSDLPFTPSERHYNALVRAVDDAAKAMGFSVAAGAVGLKSGDLSAMIDGRNGRRMDTKVAAVIADRVGAGIYRDAIVHAIKELFGLFQPDTDQQWGHRLEAALMSFGEQGSAKLAQCRREARRS